MYFNDNIAAANPDYNKYTDLALSNVSGAKQDQTTVHGENNSTYS